MAVDEPGDDSVTGRIHGLVGIRCVGGGSDPGDPLAVDENGRVDKGPETVAAG